MKSFVGTSGWYYDWNKDHTLDWYIEHSGLNAIELNASFYRFPFPNQVKSWTKKGKPLHWVIKVNRLITHRMRFSEKAYATWQKFLHLFASMDNYIDYFLFQLPPSTTPKVQDTITGFLKKAKIVKKCAFEPRNEKWFTKEMIQWAEALGITWVSIDAPEFTRDIFKTTKNVYVRVHGRTAWYHHNYNKRELKDIARRIVAVKPERIYVFFNNNHSMLKNAQAMQEILHAGGA
ncbi:MAG: DUF72 domain-containing protein [candidate division WOR-3 bacterium]|nr:MAG: DUF72 domain-containing protein [candidate division WOR-3 bacterium]